MSRRLEDSIPFMSELKSLFGGISALRSEEDNPKLKSLSPSCAPSSAGRSEDDEECSSQPVAGRSEDDEECSSQPGMFGGISALRSEEDNPKLKSLKSLSVSSAVSSAGRSEDDDVCSSQPGISALRSEEDNPKLKSLPVSSISALRSEGDNPKLKSLSGSSAVSSAG